MPTINDLSALVEKLAAAIPELNMDGDGRKSTARAAVPPEPG